MDVRILNVEQVDDASGSYSAYVLQVKSKGGKVWIVKHRYSTFDDLRKAAVREMGNLNAPFPGKQLFGRADPIKRKEQRVRRRLPFGANFRGSSE